MNRTKNGVENPPRFFLTFFKINSTFNVGRGLAPAVTFTIKELSMRILFDSKKKLHKEPFGCVTPGENCTLHIHIPATVETTGVKCIFRADDTGHVTEACFTKQQTVGAYDIWQAQVTLHRPALYFYYFAITGRTGTFRLFKQGDDTNMEAGDLWQITCVPQDFNTPDWAKGATIYQVFPDRFYKSGDCDLTGKLTPYTVHENWDEEVVWAPNEKGEVLNNDFYGGNFRGIMEKLPYLASMGVTILYLNPISKSFSSHRYDTGDYKTPDPMLGTVEEFSQLCEKAHSLGIRVILDGVYSHTGSDSLYFNKNRTFDGVGAYNSKESPYHSWYTFYRYPDSYNCWWNFDTLPTVRKLDPAFVNYIIEDEDSVVAYWLKKGADGFRLDVADELSNEFMARLKRRVREVKPDAMVMGEVWEDASNKIAYDVRRRYFVDGTLDSVMNYPFRTAILKFLHERDGGQGLRNTVLTILENYPQQVVHCNMNLLGTHDTARILTTLVDEREGNRQELAVRKLTPEQLQLARKRLLLATVLQYTLPGSPSLYYGDEACMEGGKDPFNRRTYPWGKEDRKLLEHHRRLGQLRKNSQALRLGDLEFTHADSGKIAYTKTCDGEKVRIYVNRSDENWEIPAGKVLLSYNLRNTAPDWLCLEPMGACILED